MWQHQNYWESNSYKINFKKWQSYSNTYTKSTAWLSSDKRKIRFNYVSYTEIKSYDFNLCLAEWRIMVNFFFEKHKITTNRHKIYTFIPFKVTDF